MQKIALVCASAFALAFVSMPAALAANPPVQIAKVIPYQGDEVGSANVRQCDWNSRLSYQLASQSRGQVVATTQDLTTLPGRTLRMAITRAHTAGGGSISGPKWGRVEGELWENGQMIGNFSIKRASNRPFTLSECGPLRKIANVLAEDIAEWLKHPTLAPKAAEDTQPMQPAENVQGAEQVQAPEQSQNGTD